MNGLRMEAIAISLGPLNVHWYGIILGAASIIGLLIAIREGKRFGISPDFFMDMMLIGVPSAIIGARFYFVAFKWEDYNDNFWGIFKVWNGGIAIYGALIGNLGKSTVRYSDPILSSKTGYCSYDSVKKHHKRPKTKLDEPLILAPIERSLAFLYTRLLLITNDIT
jgi:prolipoprotein diacylglyceryl transferase